VVDPPGFDDEARRMTKELRVSAEHARRHTATPDFGSSAGYGDRHFAVELLVAALVAVAVVVLILALPRHVTQVPRPAGTTKPVMSSAATPSPTALSGIQSTITSRAPLVLYLAASPPDGSHDLAARTYAGQPAGTLIVPPSDSGYDVAPDGSKVLDGGQIIADSGKLLATIPDTFPQLPIWADDSDHLCAVSDQNPLSDAGETGMLLEFDMSGHARTIAKLGPIPKMTGAWQVLACSPAADRAVVAQESDQNATVIVVQLSSGRIVAEHPVGDASVGLPIASHDGGIVAIDGPSGITIHNGMTWAVLARVVRWGSQAGFPLIGVTLNLSWDGSRILIDGGGAGGGFHPEWMVHWATNRNVATNTGTNPAVSGMGDAVPMIPGSAFFLPPSDVTADAAAAYLLTARGSLQRLPG
jgi:hypothetical protein